MVGQFALGLAITAPVFMFTNLQLRGIQATDSKQEYTFSDYLGLRLITTGLALLVIGLIVLVAQYHPETTAIMLAISMAKAFESVSDVFYGLFQQHEQMDRIARSMMIKGVVSLIAFGTGVILTGSVFWGSLGLAIVWGVVLINYDVRNGVLVLSGRQLSSLIPYSLESDNSLLMPLWHFSKLIRLAWLALPLGIVMMLISLNANLPRYFIERYAGEAELGIFAALSYLIVAGSIIIQALGQSASPRLAQLYADGQVQSYVKLLLQLVTVGALAGGLMVLAAIVAGQDILNLLYGSEYVYVNLFIWLSIAGSMAYAASFLGYGMTAARYFGVQLPLFILVTAVTGVACAWLVPSSGIYGAALALIVSALIQIIGSLGIVSAALRARIQHTEA